MTLLSVLQRIIPRSWNAGRNPHELECHEECRSFAVELGVIAGSSEVVERFDRERFALLTAYCYPAADLQTIVTITNFCAYLFFVDDIADMDEDLGRDVGQMRIMLQAHVEALRDGFVSNRNDPLQRFLAAIRGALLDRMSERWHQRFSAEVEEYLLRGTLSTTQHWATATVPSLMDYTSQRKFDSALYPAQSLIEVSERRETPVATLIRSEFRDLRDLCNLVVSFTNDIFSYPKEVVRCENPNNLLHVLMTHHRYGVDRAVDDALEILSGHVRQFVATELRLRQRSDFDPTLDGYIRGLKAWMRGNVEWSLESGRYRSPWSPFAEMRAPLGVPEITRSLGGWRNDAGDDDRLIGGRRVHVGLGIGLGREDADG